MQTVIVTIVAVIIMITICRLVYLHAIDYYVRHYRDNDQYEQDEHEQL